MRSTHPASLTGLLFGFGLLLASLLPADTPATGGVHTRVIFLTGHTEPGTGDERLWLPADGVVPLDSSARQVSLEAQTLGLEGVVNGLEATLRLSRVATRSHTTVDLGPGALATLNLHNPGGLTGSVRLDRFDQNSATFTVRMALQSQVLADTPVTVAIGERAVVGALDGPKAPYVFLVVEAHGPAKGPIKEPLTGTPAMPLEEIRAAYTDAAKEVRVQGMVILQVEVDAQGKAVVTKVIKGLPFDLPAQAQHAVEATPFAPATDADGNPIASTVNLAISFRLDD